MTGERVEQYLLTKMGSNIDTKKAQILASQNYKKIVAETLEEFKEFYNFEVEQQLAKTSMAAMNSYVKDQNLKSAVANAVDNLNNEIFQGKINDIKGMLTVCVMETQVFLDKIDLDAKKLKYIVTQK